MTDPNFSIPTPRLTITYLQPTSDTHCDFLLAVYTSPEFIRFSGRTTLQTREDVRQLLAGRFRAEHARNGYGSYLFSLTKTNTPIGTVSLMQGEEPNRYGAPDLGFAILPAYMRRGYTKEACAGLLAYFDDKVGGRFEALGLFNPENVASGAVFRSLGFEDRGIHELRVFGGVKGAVWARPGMSEDLKGVYQF
ncbi:acyl-CoA N-acyltransferase [Lasiosphaeria hispida]|uniref:Acyl-CoA N-acyltransferase n=1 Tax=Lasiosphaeria hispida TaxID=260671 RepID=A0AAJ0M8C9_9PEZI|nr:acyl-CoA N-acyltransferase [Lasiosphaeria hispida]